VKHFQKISQGVDIMPLLLAIKRRPELWSQDTFLRDYNQGIPFGCVETIFLRWPVIQDGSTMTDEDKQRYMTGQEQHESIDRPEYKLLTEARPLVMNLMHYVGGERLGRVMINKIEPGGRITPHADTPAHADYYSRFHFVLQSSPGVIFKCGDEDTYMATGECWWFNNKEVHTVVNNSAESRIHMIVDIRTSR
jgi:hypothetical protein